MLPVEAVQQSVGADANVTTSGIATATLVIGTHQATEGSLADTVTALGGSDVVTEVTSVLRVEGTD